MEKKRILSGNRPSGRLHLGNYAGALQNWAALQDEYECFFMVADWHALTSEYGDTSELKALTKEMVIDWISVGLDPERSTLFVQSHVTQHAELALLLGMITPLPWLERCPTYKQQIKELSNKDLGNFGFLGYPLLQAADILIYEANCVPIGEDQLPHLEMTREIARRFNNFYGEVFPEPQALLSDIPMLVGIDGRKMSKSYGNCIYLSDEEKTVNHKVMQMITDPARVTRKDKGHPEVCSVCQYQKVFNPEIYEKLWDQCKSAEIGCVDCKKMLAEKINTLMTPFRDKRREIESKPDYVDEVLNAGDAHAREIAEATMQRVRDAVKLY